MQTATSETGRKSLLISICVHHYTLRAPCPQGQGTRACLTFVVDNRISHLVPPRIKADKNGGYS